MDFLEVLKLSTSLAERKPEEGSKRLHATIVTNFTDDLCKKLLQGLCLKEGIYPEIRTLGYKQYHFELKNAQGELYTVPGEIVFAFFDANPYRSAEFSLEHVETLLNDLERYSEAVKASVIVQTMILPSRTSFGNLRERDALYQYVMRFNEGVRILAERRSNVHVLDTNRLVQALGEDAARDRRSLYAYDQPFTHEFLMLVCREWMAYVRARLGLTRKAIVVDLDNTLWGGVVGESGALGIALGQEYPGNAFQNFQRLLLEMFHRGIILAINSRNNWEDVKEVFDKNPHMILKESHFSSIVTNWKDKAENLTAIAEELNIGLDSLVFFDDDAMNRDLVRLRLPQVLVPDFSLAPEDYAHALLELDVFHQLNVTEEDASRGRMYAEERQRNVVKGATASPEEYLQRLGIELDVALNDASLIPRLSQLTLKTNQFNLTTRRYTEQEMEAFMKNAFVFSGDARDTFGSYGITLEAIVKPLDAETVELDTLLMSCRVMGRKLEDAFMDTILRDLAGRGYRSIVATMIPTQKNPPARLFPKEFGFEEISTDENGTIHYGLDIAEYLKAHPEPNPFIRILLKTV